MNNPFDRNVPLSGPFRDIVPLTKSDTVDLTFIPVALYIETGGTLRILTAAGNERSLNVLSGAMLPVGVKRVFSTGSSASGIHGFAVVLP